ncbi:hypothetical protein BDV96DRAFT_509931, partial [Lophiotrema nucula]
YYKNINKVLNAIKVASLLLDISKYKFNITFIKYLSFIIKIKKNFYIDSKKVKVIKE